MLRRTFDTGLVTASRTLGQMLEAVVLFGSLNLFYFSLISPHSASTPRQPALPFSPLRLPNPPGVLRRVGVGVLEGLGGGPGDGVGNGAASLKGNCRSTDIESDQSANWRSGLMCNQGRSVPRCVTQSS